MPSRAVRHQRRRLALLGLTAMIAGGCSRRMLSEFFDVAPQSAPASAAQAQARIDSATLAAIAALPRRGADAPPPAIERTLDPDSAIALLPRDHAGNIDYAAALRAGIIRPRLVPPGREVPDTSFHFKFDFYFPGPDTTFDASFPHSTHTQWVDCQQCHSRIFRYRGATIRMADVFQGKFCGECHGKVAFPVMTACERCHTRLAMPANRAKPELIGTITLARAQMVDTVKRAGGAGGSPDSTVARGVTTASLPAARFPHWVHRIRYRCKSCHMDLFEPRAGANRITMKDIDEGRFCGACHDGKTAFRAGFGACERCHVPPAAPAAATGQ